MQPNVFLRPQAGNELESCTMFCKAIPSVDLFALGKKEPRLIVELSLLMASHIAASICPDRGTGVI